MKAEESRGTQGGRKTRPLSPRTGGLRAYRPQTQSNGSHLSLTRRSTQLSGGSSSISREMPLRPQTPIYSPRDRINAGAASFFTTARRRPSTAPSHKSSYNQGGSAAQKGRPLHLMWEGKKKEEKRPNTARSMKRDEYIFTNKGFMLRSMQKHMLQKPPIDTLRLYSSRNAKGQGSKQRGKITEKSLQNGLRSMGFDPTKEEAASILSTLRGSGGGGSSGAALTSGDFINNLRNLRDVNENQRESNFGPGMTFAYTSRTTNRLSPRADLQSGSLVNEMRSPRFFGRKSVYPKGIKGYSPRQQRMYKYMQQNKERDIRRSTEDQRRSHAKDERHIAHKAITSAMQVTKIQRAAPQSRSQKRMYHSGKNWFRSTAPLY